MKTATYRYGTRAPIRDRILELMADGKVRKSMEIAEAINWPTTTSITKTLSDLKMALFENRDPRRLRKITPDNCNKGVEWQLIS